MATNFYPIRFIGVMMDSGFHALNEYLEKTNASQEVKDLSEGLNLLRSYLEHHAAGGVDDDHFSTEGVTDGLSKVTNAIEAQGGSFYGADGIA